MYRTRTMKVFASLCSFLSGNISCHVIWKDDKTNLDLVECLTIGQKGSYLDLLSDEFKPGTKSKDLYANEPRSIQTTARHSYARSESRQRHDNRIGRLNRDEIRFCPTCCRVSRSPRFRRARDVSEMVWSAFAGDCSRDLTHLKLIFDYF